MFQIHLVHFSVQVTTWRWYEYLSGLICAEGICIGFIDIVVLVGRIRLIYLLFRQHLSYLPVFITDPPVKLIFGSVSALGIIDYRHCHQLFLDWGLNILIWFNYYLFWWYFHSRTNLFAEIQVSSFHTIAEYIFVNNYHYLLFYFVIIRYFHLEYSQIQQNTKWIMWQIYSLSK